MPGSVTPHVTLGQFRTHVVRSTPPSHPSSGVTGGRESHYYARAVIGAAYRRSYYAAAASLAQAAAELPEHELFEHLVSIGRAQRAASQRLSAVRVGSAETSLS